MTSENPILNALLTRTSMHPRMVEAPAPNAQDLQLMLQAAMAAPDHGCLRPWRFTVIEGEGLRELGALFAAALKARKPAASDEDLEMTAAKALRAPMVVAFSAHLQDHPKVPHEEQIVATGCAMQQFILAADALGYGACILSGPNMHSDEVHRGLALPANERLVGLVYIGTPKFVREATRPREAPDAQTRRWPR